MAGSEGFCQYWSKEATASTRCILRGQRGLSLTELLVAMAVMGLLLGGILAIQQQGLTAYVMGSNRVETQQNARVALDLMIRELRSATAITVIGGPTDLTFTYDHDDDPITPSVPIRYQLSGTTLNRTFDGTPGDLIGGVDSFVIDALAYDPETQTWTPPNVPADVRIVRISLTTRSEDSQAVGSTGHGGTTMESTVRLRNQ